MQRLRNSASVWLSRLAVLLLAFGTPASARSVVDATGRTVEIPDRIERVMPAGPPAAVLLYTLAPEKMIGWPHLPSPAAKNLLGPNTAGLPELAPLVRDGKVQVEQIQAARPDVILDYGSTAPRYADRATMVQAATEIPVLLLDGKLERTPEIYRLLGAILGTVDRRAALGQPAAGAAMGGSYALSGGLPGGSAGGSPGFLSPLLPDRARRRAIRSTVAVSAIGRTTCASREGLPPHSSPR